MEILLYQCLVLIIILNLSFVILVGKDKTEIFGRRLGFLRIY